MRSLINLAKGWRLVRAFPLLVVGLFLLNLIFSLTLAPPMHRALKDSLGKSLAGERMTKGFDYLWWEEFRDTAGGPAGTFSPAVMGKGALLFNLERMAKGRLASLPGEILLAAILFILIRTFVMGGVLTIYQNGRESAQKAGFFISSARLFPVFLGIAGLAAVFYLGLIGGLERWSDLLVGRAAANASSEVSPFFLALAFSLLFLLLVLLLQMVFDYARILTVANGSRRVFQAVAAALRYIFRHLLPVLGIFFLILSAQLGISLLYIFLDGVVPQASPAGVAIGMLLQQGFIFSLVWIRCWLYASQLELVRYTG